MISGGAKGADSIAESLARYHRLHVATIKALWDLHGRGAGHRRNQMMLSLPEPAHDWVEAFWDGESPGTRGTIQLAGRYGLPVNVHQPDGRQAISGL